MTTKSDTPNVMQALDAGLAQAAEYPEDLDTEEAVGYGSEGAASPPAEEALPPGYQQEMEAMSKAELRRLRAKFYGWSLLGFVLVPVMFILRTGRWSMRNIAAHHRGWEFGPW